MLLQAQLPLDMLGAGCRQGFLPSPRPAGRRLAAACLQRVQEPNDVETHENHGKQTRGGGGVAHGKSQGETHPGVQVHSVHQAPPRPPPPSPPPLASTTEQQRAEAGLARVPPLPLPRPPPRPPPRGPGLPIGRQGQPCRLPFPSPAAWSTCSQPSPGPGAHCHPRPRRPRRPHPHSSLTPAQPRLHRLRRAAGAAAAGAAAPWRHHRPPQHPPPSMHGRRRPRHRPHLQIPWWVAGSPWPGTCPWLLRCTLDPACRGRCPDGAAPWWPVRSRSRTGCIGRASRPCGPARAAPRGRASCWCTRRSGSGGW